jgi:hypothetical protein
MRKVPAKWQDLYSQGGIDIAPETILSRTPGWIRFGAVGVSFDAS